MSTDADFEAAFAEAVDTPVAETPEVETTVAEAAPEIQAEQEAAPQPEATSEADQEAAPAAAVQEPAQPVAEQQPAPVQQPVQQIDPAALADQVAARLKPQEPAKQDPVQEAPKPAAYTDFLDENQKKSLEQFEAEWPEVAAPVAALISAHVKAALDNQRKEILGEVQQQMAPIQQVTAQSQEALYYATLEAQHPDFREVASQLPGWIESQPYAKAKEYIEMYNSPNPVDAVKLMSAYKQAIGSTGAAPAHPASSAVQAAPKAAPVPAAAVAATLAPPAARRSSQTPSRDPNDAEAAFHEAFG